MSTPQVPVIQSSKASLNEADTATLLAAIFGLTALPATKTETSLRSITINLVPPVAPATTQTSNVNMQFNP